MILGALQFRRGGRLLLDAPQFRDDDVDELADRLVGTPGVDRHRAGVTVRAETAEDRVGKSALLADVLEQPGTHRSAENRVQDVARIARVMVLPVAGRPEADMTLLEILVANDDRGQIGRAHV